MKPITDLAKSIFALWVATQILTGCSEKRSPSNTLLGKWQLVGDTNLEFQFLGNGQVISRKGQDAVVLSYSLTSASNMIVIDSEKTNTANFFFVSPDEVVLKTEEEDEAKLLKRVR